MHGSRASIVAPRPRITVSADSSSSVYRFSRTSDRMRACSSAASNGLMRKSSAAGLDRLSRSRVIRLRRDEHHRNEARGRMVLEPPAERRSRVRAASEIDEDEVRWLRRARVERCIGARDTKDGKCPSRVRRRLQKTRARLIVVGNENPGGYHEPFRTVQDKGRRGQP